MKACKRWVKRGALKFVPKVFNTIVILGLVLQPAGTPGIWNIAFAESTDQTLPVAEETAPAPEPVKEEVVTPIEEVTPVAEEEIITADTTTSSTISTDVSSVPDTSADFPVPAPSIGDTGASTDIPSDSEETTFPAEEAAPAETPDVAPVEIPSTDQLEALVSQETSVEATPVVSVEEAVASVAEPVDETVCLAASIEGDSEVNWTVGEDGNTTVTNEPVKLGVRYVFPLDKEVTVTFTCLPKDESKRAPLKIEQIVASDIDLPDGMAAASEYAYDITTDGMKNGTFKYDLTLPKFEGTEARIAYIEKSVDAVKTEALGAEDLKEIDQEDIDNKEKTVEATDVDHFTVIVPLVITENENPSKKVRICHATSSHSNPYVSEQPNKSGDVSGHDGHDGPIWFSGITVSWGDIIPPFDYDESSFYPGKNWDATGRAIWNNDCNIPSARIIIKKNAINNNAKDFAFNNNFGNGNPSVFLLDDDANGTLPNTRTFEVLPGTYSVSEDPVAGWQQESVVCDKEETIDSIDVASGETVTCTFTNEQFAKITLVKNTLGGDDTFDFDAIGAGLPADISLATVAGTASQIFSDLDQDNTYSIAENVPAGWDLTSATCTGTNTPRNITPDPGEEITCTFTNTKEAVGSIRVCKMIVDAAGNVVDGSALPGSTFTVSGLNTTTSQGGPAGVLDTTMFATGLSLNARILDDSIKNENDDAQCVTYDNLKLGGYYYGEETIPASGWESPKYNDQFTVPVHTINNFFSYDDKLFDGINNDGSRNKNVDGHIVLTADRKDRTLVVLNQYKPATLIVKKVIVGSNDPATRFSFSVNGGGSQSFEADGQNNLTVSRGTYTVTESPASGYTTTYSTDCTNGVLENGETITCTITNTFNTGSLKVNKLLDADGNGSYETSNPTTFTWSVDGSGTNAMGATLAGVISGTHSVNESAVSGYHVTGWYRSTSEQPSCTNTDSSALPALIDVNTGETTEITICNARNTGTITVDKVTVPSGDQTVFDFTVVSTETGVNEAFNLADQTAPWSMTLPTGVYTVSEGSLPPGWLLGALTCISNQGPVTDTFDLDAGENVTCTITNTKKGHIIVDKVTNPSQSGGAAQSFSFVTTGTGYAGFSLTDQDVPNDQSLVPGTYTVAEVLPLDNWQLDSVECVYDDESVGISVTNGKEIVLDAGDTVHCTFTNTQLSDVHGYKWNDLNGNGARDCIEENGDGELVFRTDQICELEPLLSDWTIFIDENGNEVLDGEEQSTQTSGSDDEHFGWYWFENLLPGTYSLCEVPQDGWNQTYPVDYDGEEEAIIPVCHTVTLPNDNACGVGASVNAVTGSECNFGNHFTPPALQISKSNDSGAPETPGNDVLYTITVTAPQSNTTDVEDVHVTDLPPAGFVYVPGTALGATLSHEYASPGVWSLGTMRPGDTVTLTYATKISGSQDAGLYNDLAFAKGTSVTNASVLATCVGSCRDEGTTPFTGTDVEVVLPAAPASVALINIVDRDVDTKTVTKTKRVLGAATVLPYTGSSINTILFALMMLLGGLILLLLSKRSTWLLIRHLSRSMMKVFLFAVVGSILLAGQSASAAPGDLNVQIEQPKAVVNSAEFKVGFVVLDITADDSIDVKCEIKYEDGSFAEFDSYSIAAGGTSGDCIVRTADMPTDGTYTFKVIATEGEEGDSDTATADPIELISGTPSTPLNYSRADDSCTASFTTANDELTSKVELYRSTSSTFTADASTLVQEVAIGPNISGTITDPNGNCSDYFYAIRAVALSGLGSGFVGDERVVIDNENKIKYKTDTKKIVGKTTTLGAIPVAGGGAGIGSEGAVEGAATTGEEETVQPETGAEGSVLGEMTEAVGDAAGGAANWVQAHPWWTALVAFITLVLVKYSYGAYQRKNNGSLQ